MSNMDTVCVTGASGFIGSWVVRLLLEKGYKVKATVQDLGNEEETKHLEAMEGAKERLTLCQLDLLNYETVESAIKGTVGVFHLASPCVLVEVKDPQNEILEPAIKGTKHVLQAAHNTKVKRVVLTSSVTAIIASPDWPSDVPRDENCWTDVEFCKEKRLWYSASKTIAEKTAWDLAKETGLDLVVINPGPVFGPIIPPSINATMDMLLRLIQGCKDTYEYIFMGCVHVKDCAEAHILVYENPAASGRHLCVESVSHWSDFANLLDKLYPEFKVHSFLEETQPGLLRVKDAPKKLTELGLTFTPMEAIIKDAVSSLKEKGYVK